MTFDFESQSNSDSVPVSKASLEQLQLYMDEADHLNEQIEELEGMLNSINARYNLIRTTLLPEVMTELQTSEWTNSIGSKVKITDFVSGSLPKDPEKRAIAIKWLEDNGSGAIIKSELSVEFSKSQHNEALAIKDDLVKQGLPAIVESSVHAGTLQAHVKEKLRNGEEVPFETLGVYAGRMAKIVHSNKKRI